MGSLRSVERRIMQIDLKLQEKRLDLAKLNETSNIAAQCLSPRPRPKNLPLPDIAERQNGEQKRPFSTGSYKTTVNGRLDHYRRADGLKLNDNSIQNYSIILYGKTHRCQEHDLQFISNLGDGSCGNVAKMRHIGTGILVAVKQMRRSNKEEECKRIVNDLDVQLKCHCEYIVQCYGYLIKEAEVWIVMELMATSFDKLLNLIVGPIPEHIIGKLAVATVKALNYLKEHHGVMHRDVKPSNILINERGQIKLCDFGISGQLVDSLANTKFAGCTAYMAPERIDSPCGSSYDIRADVWSLGITLLELATGRYPYNNFKTDFELLLQVVYDPPPTLPSDGSFSNDFRNFVNSCLHKDYNKRPKYKTLLEHPFILFNEIQDIDASDWFQRVCTNL